MKMVSAAKFKRNLKSLEHVKDYGSGLESIMTSLSKRLFDDNFLPCYRKMIHLKSPLLSFHQIVVFVADLIQIYLKK